MLEEVKAPRIENFGGPEAESANVKTSPCFIHLRYTLPSDLHIVPPFVDRLMRFISALPEVNGNNVEIELALREALVNAIVHGNKRNSHKSVQVKCRFSMDGEVSMTVEDEGRGFQHNSVPDPTSPDNRLRTRGRGIYLMRSLMDEVDFEQGGSVVHMRKRVKSGGHVQCDFQTNRTSVSWA